jgi:hypothetical protein
VWQAISSQQGLLANCLDLKRGGMITAFLAKHAGSDLMGPELVPAFSPENVALLHEPSQHCELHSGKYDQDGG